MMQLRVHVPQRKILHATAKRGHMLQLRPSAAKKMNKYYLINYTFEKRV